MRDRGYLLDAQASHLQAEAFEVPTLRELTLIKPGDMIKVGLIVKANPYCKFEKVWVKVTGPLRGILVTQPVFCKDDWLVYDMLRFELKHVMQILKDIPIH